jgi:hypothetical protein
MKCLITLVLLLSFASYTSAQARPDSLYSEVLKEKRKLKILIPSDYKPGSQKKYDVVYILDGEGNLDNFSHIHRFAKGEGLVPDLILVAVINGERARDLRQRKRKELPARAALINSSRSSNRNLFLTLIKHIHQAGRIFCTGTPWVGSLPFIRCLLTLPFFLPTWLRTRPYGMIMRTPINWQFKNLPPSLNRVKPCLLRAEMMG